MGSQGYSESRGRSDDDVWMPHHQNIKHLVQDNLKSTTEGVATMFKRGISTGGRVGGGEVSENDCTITEQPQDILRTNLSVLNTSRGNNENPKFAVIEARKDMIESESNTNLRN